jgi:hypothetical protein
MLGVVMLADVRLKVVAPLYRPSHFKPKLVSFLKRKKMQKKVFLSFQFSLGFAKKIKKINNTLLTHLFPLKN